MTEPSPGRPPSSQASNEQGIEEADALLTGQDTGKDTSISNSGARSKWREIGLFVWALIATAAVVVLAVIYQHSQAETHSGAGEGCIGKGCEVQKVTGKRNLIMMVSDGMGPTSLSLTRSWINHTYSTPYDRALVLDDYLIGQSRTRSTSSLVTDSAAGATAFSCGLKSYNGAISVTPDEFLPCGSVMEAAKRKGYTTGLVVTTRITDATPAVFVSHARRREMEEFIARQMVGESHPLGRMVDLMFGGGRCKFLPNTTAGGCRSDGRDVVELARMDGWGYIDEKVGLERLETLKLPLLGLFAHQDIPYEIDRQHQTDRYPSLEEMTTTALRTLAAATKDSEQGFFVMIEGSRIDHAGHANDPAAQVHEVLAYDRAMAAVLDFIKHEETPTLMVATSDHETGGLAVARQLHREYPPYVWYPGVLANASHSASHVAHEYHNHLREASITPDLKSDHLRDYLTSLSSRTLGVKDCASDEIDTLITDPAIAAYTFADMISRRAQTGWSTHGHSGADVNIYTSSPALAAPLRGNHENTEVGEFLRRFLDLDDEVEEVTRLLREHARAVGEEVFLGTIPEAGERLDGQSHLDDSYDQYGGDHRTRRGGCEICGAL